MNFNRSTAVSLLICVVGGCKCSDAPIGKKPSATACIDFDKDGFGSEASGKPCGLGLDCDDGDNAASLTCDCTRKPFAGGCECSAAGAVTTATCPYTGDLTTEKVGACHRGSRACAGGKWAMACVGQVVPIAEVCDQLDNDCDGTVDNGLPGCNLPPPPGSFGPGKETGFDPTPANSEAILKNPDGTITLSTNASTNFYAWIANTNDGTVSKLNTQTGKEEARYISSLGPIGLTAGNPNPCGNSTTNTGNCPSRTSLDAAGNVYVANRAFTIQGTVTKIANIACPDKNGNGTIETSRDVSGNGRIEVGNPLEYLGINDECILWTANVGPIDGVPRALAVDAGDEGNPDGYAWVGLYNAKAFYKIDGATGATLVGPVSVAPQMPYGAALDQIGRVWSTSLGAGSTVTYLSSFDSKSPSPIANVITAPTNASYGIAVDENGWIWLAGWSSTGVRRYKPESSTWDSFSPPGQGGGAGRGIAADGKGNLYIAWSGSDSVTKMTTAGVELWTTPIGKADPIGVGLDPQGLVWAIAHGSDTAVKLDADGNITIPDAPVGDQPYTYSDFTGYAHRTFVASRGTYRANLNICGEGQMYPLTLSWEAITPPNTRVDFKIRVADTLPALNGATAYGPFSQPGHNGSATDSPVDLTLSSIPSGKYMQVEVTLSSTDHVSTPTVKNFQIGSTCPQG